MIDEIVCRFCGRELPPSCFDDLLDPQELESFGREVMVGKVDVCWDCFNRQVEYVSARMKRWEEYHDLRERVISTLGGKCAVCGITDRRVLQIDHRDGKGAEDRRKYRRGRDSSRQYLNHILENPDSYQILCANHNWIKRVDNNEDDPRIGKRIAKNVPLDTAINP